MISQTTKQLVSLQREKEALQAQFDEEKGVLMAQIGDMAKTHKVAISELTRASQTRLDEIEAKLKIEISGKSALESVQQTFKV